MCKGKAFCNIRLIKELVLDQAGFTLPIALIMILIIMACTAILSIMATHNFRRIKSNELMGSTYVVAEGAINQMLGQMAVYGALFDQLAPLAIKPNSYTEYIPSDYAVTNGIPVCSSPACQRDLYPLSGGLLKNHGPLEGDGTVVDSSYPISEQLDFSDPPEADVTLQGMSGWVQLERMDNDVLGASSVGGNLSSSLAEGGNARAVRYRLSGIAMREIRGQTGSSSIVSLVEMPIQ